MSELIDPKTQLPAYMQEDWDGDAGLGAAENEIRPPRIICIQRESKPPLSDLFNIGDVALTPMNEKICGKGEFFTFTPILAIVSYNKCNPHGVKPFIAERSLDPNSELAKKCNNLVKEPHPENPNPIRYMKFLEILVDLHRPDGNILSLMSFFSTRYKNGTTALSVFKSRPGKMWAKNFVAHEVEQDAGNNRTHALQITAPGPDSGVVQYVSEEDYERYKQLNEKYSQMQVVADYEDTGSEEEVVVTDDY